MNPCTALFNTCYPCACSVFFVLPYLASWRALRLAERRCDLANASEALTLSEAFKASQSVWFIVCLILL